MNKIINAIKEFDEDETLGLIRITFDKNELMDILNFKNLLIDELTIENKGYKDAIDRQNKYIESYKTAIERFDESNRGN